jgi:nicotinate-nucleotide adenylyltransferase
VNTGIFGGTFDPPHVGHLIVAQDAALALGLDRILFVPAAVPPHKSDRELTPAALRLSMLELAIEGNDCFLTEPLELHRAGPSFTVDTLRELHYREPATAWTLLVGADQYTEFSSWREPATIRGLARIGVLSRAGSKAVRETDGVRAIDVTRIDISSSAVRARVAAGRPIRYMVPPAVEQFIADRRLYVRTGAAVTG